MNVHMYVYSACHNYRRFNYLADDVTRMNKKMLNLF